jgi:CRP/FNR family transcriptional regulator, cyclic AMP receptor protein
VKRTSKAEQIELLGNVSLFSECSKKELGQVASMMDERRVESGTELTREGDEGDEFFVVAEGLAEAVIGKKKVGSIKPGSFFGEMALLDQGPRVATVTAKLPTRVLVLDAKGFGRVVRDSPSVAIKVMKTLAERLRALETSPTR